jgi:hypothetical protein
MYAIRSISRPTGDIRPRPSLTLTFCSKSKRNINEMNKLKNEMI